MHLKNIIKNIIYYERADIAALISDSTIINKATKESLLRNFVGIYNNQ